MSLSNPINPPLVNEAVAKAASTGASFGVNENETKVNQLHGIASNNAQGAGIPKQVSNVRVSIANASTGTTCTVAVLFALDPTDKNFSGISIWVTGYQGNSNPVQVGSGTSSPTKIVLNNTGETVTFTIQGYGNGGSAPFNQSPTCSGTLPKSTGGGFGSSTVVSPPATSGTASPGQLAKFATPATTLTGADLTGDVTTSGDVATVVGKIQTTPVTNSTPKEGDSLRFSLTDAKYMRDMAWDFWIAPLSTTGVTVFLPGISTVTIGGSSYSTNGTLSNIPGTATELVGTKFTTSAVAGTQSGTLMPTAAAALCSWGLFRRLRFRLALGQTTNMRIWIGVTSLANASLATLQSDTPNTNFVGFRYSTAAGDTKYQCVTQTDNTHQTKNAETTATHVDTNTHTFDITFDNTTANFYIDDTLVGSQSGNMPSLTQVFQPCVSFDNVASAAAKNWTFFYCKGTLVIL